MVTFWLLAALLIVLAIGITLFPLFRKPSQQQQEVDQKQINVDIAREQLIELKQNLDAGEVSQEEYDSIKYEIEGSLIDDISDEEEAKSAAEKVPLGKFSNKLAMIIIAVFVPLSSVLLYLKLGTPNIVDMDLQAAMQRPVDHNNGQMPSVEQMIEGLLAKLRENPNDEQGWSLLGRTFMAVKRYKEAHQVYGRLLQLKGQDEPDVLVSMADALAMSQGGNISGEPMNLVQRALKVDPKNLTALWLAGLGAEEQNKPAEAVAYWKRILPLVKDDPTSTKQVNDMIGRAGQQVPPSTEVKNDSDVSSKSEDPTAQVAVKVRVTLDQAFNDKVKPDDVVFVFAKATQGPPMPLAAVKKSVQDMPLEVVLDDSMAMMPNMKISRFKQVVVSARVSKSGSPSGKRGDLMSQEVTVDVIDNPSVNLTIGSEIQ